MQDIVCAFYLLCGTGGGHIFESSLKDLISKRTHSPPTSKSTNSTKGIHRGGSVLPSPMPETRRG